MMLNEPQEEMDDALWLLAMTAQLLRHYEGGIRWGPDNHPDAKTTPYKLQFQYQLATVSRPTSSPTVNLFAVLLNGYCEDAERTLVPWRDVKLRIDAVRGDMKQHIDEQGRRIIAETWIQGGVERRNGSHYR